MNLLASLETCLETSEQTGVRVPLVDCLLIWELLQTEVKLSKVESDINPWDQMYSARELKSVSKSRRGLPICKPNPANMHNKNGSAFQHINSFLKFFHTNFISFRLSYLQQFPWGWAWQYLSLIGQWVLQAAEHNALVENKQIQFITDKLELVLLNLKYIAVVAFDIKPMICKLSTYPHSSLRWWIDPCFCTGEIWGTSVAGTPDCLWLQGRNTKRQCYTTYMQVGAMNGNTNKCIKDVVCIICIISK